MTGNVDLDGVFTDEPDAQHSPNLDIVAGPNDPLPNARLFVRDRYTDAAGRRLLLYVRGTFYSWTDGLWNEVEAADLRSVLYNRFDGTFYASGGELKPFQPNRRSVANLIEALAALPQLGLSW